MKGRDLTCDLETGHVLELASALLESGALGEARKMRDAANPPWHPVAIQAVINAESKEKMRTCPPCWLSVIFPMYHEQNRVQPSSVHKNGQNFLRNKMRQLTWLFEEVPESGFFLLAV